MITDKGRVQVYGAECSLTNPDAVRILERHAWDLRRKIRDSGGTVVDTVFTERDGRRRVTVLARGCDPGGLKFLSFASMWVGTDEWNFS